jgi:PAS domain S-box-containing protein
MEFLSNGSLELTGFSPDDIIWNRRLSYNDLIHPDDQKFVFETVQAGTQNHQPFEMIYRIITASGEQKWVWEKGEGVFKNDDSLLALEGFITDITDLIETQKALRQSQERFSLAMEGATDGLWDWKIDTNDIYYSPRWKEMLGFNEDEIENSINEWEKRVLPEDLPHAQDEINAVISMKQDMFHTEFRMMHKDGHLVHILSRGIGIPDKQGRIIRMVGTHVDISALRSEEQKSRHLQNYLKNIIDSMPSILIGIDKNMHISQWNHEAERITNILASEAQGQDLTRVFPQLANEKNLILTAIDKRTIQKNERIIRVINGQTFVWALTIFPLVANGIEGAVIRIDDITEQVRIEELMIQSEKMLTVGGLAAGMAHEINNPLAGILQNIQVVQNRLTTTLPKNELIAQESGTSIEAIETYMKNRGIFEMINAAMKSGTRAAEIVENILSFSRKSESQPTPCDLGEILDKAVDLASNDYNLKKNFDFRKIKIIKEYDPATPLVRCEPMKIQQVFLNILRNGAESMIEKQDGEYQPQFILKLFSDQDKAVVEIEDNGPGIPEKIKNHIFEPFFTTKQVGRGTGLGLSISYFIITESHNGELFAESKEGEWTKFTIKLPIDGKSQ